MDFDEAPMANVNLPAKPPASSRVVIAFVAAAFASAALTPIFFGSWNLGAVLFIGVLGGIPAGTIAGVGWKFIGCSKWRRRKSAPAVAAFFGISVAGLSLIAAAFILSIGVGLGESELFLASMMASLAFMFSMVLFGPAALILGAGAGVISHYWTALPSELPMKPTAHVADG